MALLVTGSMGHVGLEVVRQAVQQGRHVIAQYRGTFVASEAEAMAGRATFVRADLTDEPAVAALCKRHGVTGCLHTAAVPNEAVARTDPAGAVRSNIGAVGHLLELARQQAWRRFVYVSTGSVFQGSTDPARPILEDHPTSVANTYSTTKRGGEMLTTMYRTQFGVPAASVRISWVYGPPQVPRVRENPRGPIPWFLKCALSGMRVEEPSGSDFLASYTHVTDVAAGLLAAYDAAALNHDIYHLGWGRNFSTAEVVRAVTATVPAARISVGPGTAPWTDHTRMRGPLAGDRLLNDTGWRPALDLDRGVASFAGWMLSNARDWR
jgi:nucleoside-diphosphate-sugar epimerase